MVLVVGAEAAAVVAVDEAVPSILRTNATNVANVVITPEIVLGTAKGAEEGLTRGAALVPVPATGGPALVPVQDPVHAEFVPGAGIATLTHGTEMATKAIF